MFDPSKPPLSLAELAHRSFARHVDSPCLGTKDKTSGKYKYLSYGEVSLRVRHTAGGLSQLGLVRGDRAAILAENSANWAISDLACQMLGLVSVSLFSTLPPSQVRYILEDSGASLIFVSDAKQLKKVTEIAAELTSLKTVVIFDAGAVPAPDVPAEETGNGEGVAAGKLRILSLADLERNGDEHFARNPTEYETTWPAAATGDPATIIYTSGTTGDPKGVVLTQRNIIANLEAILPVFQFSSQDLFLSFLPLAHVYERTAGFFLPLRVGAGIAYCESLFTVDKNLREARPTIMFCVPRLYEAMSEKLYAAADSLPADKKPKYLDALKLAQKAGAAKGNLAGAPSLGLIEHIKYWLYDGPVYAKIREKFGGRLRAFVSGGAPMSPELAALFTGIGINICEGYGLTETSPVISTNLPGSVRLGTVGRPLPGVKVKIAEDGEILVHGDSVFKGYWNKPKETGEALDEQGWFHTGDIGELTEGYLRITDRKKDLLVLANGKKVAPAPIELKISQSRYIRQIVLLGDKQKAVAALIVPNMEAVREFATQNSLSAENDEALLKLPEITKLMRGEVDAHSGELADFEKIKKITLLPKEFSIEAGEMTPTLKIKRKVVAEKYGESPSS